MQHYATDRWQRRHWQTETRYYIAEVTQDLFGDWQLHRCWGSRTSARGNEQHLPTASYEEAVKLLQDTAKRISNKLSIYRGSQIREERRQTCKMKG